MKLNIVIEKSKCGTIVTMHDDIVQCMETFYLNKVGYLCSHTPAWGLFDKSVHSSIHMLYTRNMFET